MYVPLLPIGLWTPLWPRLLFSIYWNSSQWVAHSSLEKTAGIERILGFPCFWYLFFKQKGDWFEYLGLAHVDGPSPWAVCIRFTLRSFQILPILGVLGKPSLLSPALPDSAPPKFREYAFIYPVNIKFQPCARYSFRGQGHSDEHISACLMGLKYNLTLIRIQPCYTRE